MRQRRALGIALGLSFGLHAIWFAGITVAPFFKMSLAVPIEIVTMKKHAPAPPLLEPPAAQTPAAPKPSTPRSHPGAKPQAPPAPPAPPVQDVHAVGPSSANFTIILRTAQLRTSPHRDAVEQLLALLPDYHTLLDGTSLHLFDDIDALLIATADPRDVAATFVAARHRADARFDAVTRKHLDAGDPRVFRALGPELTLLGPPEVLAKLDEVDPTGLSEGRRWIAALRGFDTRNPQAALQLTIADLSQFIRFVGPVPMPHSVQLSVSADAAPAVRLLCDFDTDELAASFCAMWPEIQRRVGELAPLFAGVLDDLPAKRQGHTVELVGHLPQRQVTVALQFVGMLARPPEIAPTSRSQAPNDMPSVSSDMQ